MKMYAIKQSDIRHITKSKVMPWFNTQTKGNAYTAMVLTHSAKNYAHITDDEHNVVFFETEKDAKSFLKAIDNG